MLGKHSPKPPPPGYTHSFDESAQLSARESRLHLLSTCAFKKKKNRILHLLAPWPVFLVSQLAY